MSEFKEFLLPPQQLTRQRTLSEPVTLYNEHNYQ
jgi:hypothetical protein